VDDRKDQEKLSHRPFAGLEGLRGRVRDRREEVRLGESPPEEPPPLAEVPPDLDEDQLFAREMAGVRPLGRENYVPGRRDPNAPPAPVDDDAEAMAQLADLVEGRSTFDFTSSSDEQIEGIAQGLDRRLLKRLRQGNFAVQAHLDLHGKTRQEARLAVERFLAESRARRRRCVLLVHGRGLNSKDQIPVLKEALKVWLARGRIARSVLAFCSARPVDGGVGAVYVLLRK
jgi:DNA-nicking Smr family endonuclease